MIHNGADRLLKEERSMASESPKTSDHRYRCCDRQSPGRTLFRNENKTRQETKGKRHNRSIPSRFKFNQNTECPVRSRERKPRRSSRLNINWPPCIQTTSNRRTCFSPNQWSAECGRFPFFSQYGPESLKNSPETETRNLWVSIYSRLWNQSKSKSDLSEQ